MEVELSEQKDSCVINKNLTMIKKLGALVFLALMSFAPNCHCTSDLRKSWKVSSDSKEYLVPGTLYFHGHSSYVFGLCESKGPKDATSEILCNVTNINHSTGQEHHCKNVQVFAHEGRELFLNGYLQLTPYSRKRVIVSWWEQSKEKASDKKKSFFNIGLLNMEDCKTSYLDFPIDKSGWGLFPSVLLYPSEVNIILYSKEACKTTDKCRVTYDVHGKQIGGPHPYLPEKMGYASPVSSQYPKKGFYQTVQESNSLTVLFVDSKGLGTKLMTEEFEDGVTKQRVAFSNAHEFYSVCRLPVVTDKKPTKIHCHQFNSKGPKIFKTDVMVPQTVGWVALRNLPEGGFALATSACDDPQQKNGKNCNGFKIYKINAAGKQSQSKTINDFDLKCYEAPESKTDHTELGTRIYENKENEFCFAFSCLQSNTLNYTSTCVPRKSVEDLKI